MKQRKPTTNAKPRKRWIVIGPGIVLALILALQILIANRQKPVEPPIIERQVVGSSGAARSVLPTPEIGYILERRDRLALSDRQVKVLTELQAEWQEKSKPLSADLKKASEDFDVYMKGAGSKATMRDIQSHAGPVSELSREISSLRRVYWEKALQTLNKEQRQAVDKELSRGYQPKAT